METGTWENGVYKLARSHTCSLESRAVQVISYHGQLLKMRYLLQQLTNPVPIRNSAWDGTQVKTAFLAETISVFRKIHP